jgi:hypothetical protein
MERATAARDAMAEKATAAKDAVAEKATAAKDAVAVKATAAKAKSVDFAAVVSEKSTQVIDKLGSATKKTAEFVKDDKTKGYVASAVGGAAIVGVPCAGICLVCGGAIGATLGLIPALFTFGLSIPVGAVIGGCCGTAVGATAGGTVGAALGCGLFNKRAEIRYYVQNVEIAVSSLLDRTSRKVAKLLKEAKWKFELVRSDAHAELASVRVHSEQFFAAGRATTVEVAAAARRNLGRAYRSLRQTLADETVQVSAASAAGGAAILGVGGGAAGLFAGGALGAAIGFIPALFTFGLSIPVGAVIGAGCGTLAGVTTGGAVGLVGGGVTGYGAYSRYIANKANGKGPPSEIDALSSTGGCS